MDERRLDRLARSLAVGAPRRRIAGGLAVALLGRHAVAQPARACKRVGKSCDRNADCCDGARCKGGACRCTGDREECGGRCRDLDKDDRHCGACNNRCVDGETCTRGVCVGEGGCPAGADSCAGPPFVSCGAVPNCYCVQTTAGETRCADTATTNGTCGACERDADCAVLGPGAFCVSADTELALCCVFALGSNVCMLPCPPPADG